MRGGEEDVGVKLELQLQRGNFMQKAKLNSLSCTHTRTLVLVGDLHVQAPHTCSCSCTVGAPRTSVPVNSVRK